ncbi:hypothetical protein NVS55_28485 [Myxococcus stipitatus]|uniref:hypothetical protein n=1 Tax=Myxococcus stipitatus TaxID=83455 RepID=UPI003144F242
MGLGLLCFGFATGGITGMSTFEGISQTLLTTVFAFGGGALLTFGGFVRMRQPGSGTALLRVSRVGAGLCCFSLGLVGGTLGGISLRVHLAEKAIRGPVNAAPAQGRPQDPAPRKPVEDRASAFVLHSDIRNECARIMSNPLTIYSGEEGAKLAREHLGWVHANLSCAP